MIQPQHLNSLLVVNSNVFVIFLVLLFGILFSFIFIHLTFQHYIHSILSNETSEKIKFLERRIIKKVSTTSSKKKN